MRLVGNTNLGFRQSGLPQRPRSSESRPTPRAESRALVAVEPALHSHRPVPVHTEAPFLAQLIANKDQHPQTRERRRAEPEAAIAAYNAVSALTARH